MKNEFGYEQRLKLRQAIDKVAVDLGVEARKIVKKQRVFTYFLLYRFFAIIIIPIVMAAYIIISRYIDSGILNISVYSLELLGVSFLNSLIIILVFSRKTASLRQLINSIVDNTPYTDEQIVISYRESFSIPTTVTLWEFLLSVFLILVPIVIIDSMGIRPDYIALKEVILAWWISTLSLVLLSYMFYQSWVESSLTRLYDYGIRISSDVEIKRDADIFLRIGIFTGLIIVTIILIYSNMLYMLASRVHVHAMQYMIQVAIMSVIILVPIFLFFLMLFKSIQKSFDILSSKMRIVQSGDYSVRILNNRDDHIGRLYDDFDYLVSAINNVLANLEKEVSRRTARLEEVTSKISKYVSPQLYSKICSSDTDISLSYVRKKLTVFFSDIVGFTTSSENLAPEDLSRILNQYLDAMAKIALKWGGTIDKYIGDAIMIFFGDPEFTNDKDHAKRCAGMALDMLGSLQVLRMQWKSSGIIFPLHLRIGINTGFCTVGNFGSESRMDYTVIGGAVNLASRLESAAPVDGILVSDATRLLIKDSFVCVPAGELMLKGIDHPVKAWQIMEKGESGEVSAIHVQGMDLSIDRSAMTEESKKKARQALKDAYDSLG